MPRIPLVALTGFAYNRVRLTKGHAFEALNATDAHVLTTTRMARHPGAVADAAVLPDAEVAAVETDYLHPADADETTGTPGSVPSASPRRRRGRPRKYETAALTPDE